MGQLDGLSMELAHFISRNAAYALQAISLTVLDNFTSCGMLVLLDVSSPIYINLTESICSNIMNIRKKLKQAGKFKAPIFGAKPRPTTPAILHIPIAKERASRPGSTPAILNIPRRFDLWKKTASVGDKR